MQPRPVSSSRVEMNELVMPNDTNALGNCMGGRVMHLIDIAAAIAARRHARTTCVTAGIDEMLNAANLTFVALDETGRPTPVPPLETETEVDKKREKAAQERRKRRLARLKE